MGCASSKLKYSKVSLKQNKVILKDIDLFVLDNSIRESTVAQNRGHVKEDKYTIWNAVRGCGIHNCIVATFESLPSVENEWLEELLQSNVMWDGTHGNAYAFSELYDGFTADMRPKLARPLGLSKILKYKVPNCIFELDINYECHKNGVREKEYLDIFTQLIIDRMTVMRDYHPESIVFINYRDAPSCFQDPVCNRRIRDITRIMSRLDKRLRPNGILFEDSTGEVFPWMYKDLVSLIRGTMYKYEWNDSHLLVHVHKNFGLAEASVLECLRNGATGIWCGVSEEGAATGSAGSLMTLTNLARLGNTYVTSQFDFPKLREAAITITKFSSGQLPYEKQEIYGSRALDLLWSDGTDGHIFDFKTLFDCDNIIRVTSFTSPSMFRTRLVQVFGYTEYDWDITVCTKMQWQLREDLIAGHKYDYQSALGLLDLYLRAGGVQYKEEMILKCYTYQEVPDTHILIVQLKEWFYNHESAEIHVYHKISYDMLVSPSTTSSSSYLMNTVADEILDTDREYNSHYHLEGGEENYYINWNELCIYAKWAILEYSSESSTWTIQQLLYIIYTHNQYIYHPAYTSTTTGTSTATTTTTTTTTMNKSGIDTIVGDIRVSDSDSEVVHSTILNSHSLASLQESFIQRHNSISKDIHVYDTSKFPIMKEENRISLYHDYDKRSHKSILSNHETVTTYLSSY